MVRTNKADTPELSHFNEYGVRLYFVVRTLGLLSDAAEDTVVRGYAVDNCTKGQ